LKEGVEMNTSSAVSGFSELKELLIRTYKIERPSIEVRLHFSELEGQLLMHDYDDHKKVIVLSNSFIAKSLSAALIGNARELCLESLEAESPAADLNDGFLLYGYFRF
jgi:hypothetical protein